MAKASAPSGGGGHRGGLRCPRHTSRRRVQCPTVARGLRIPRRSVQGHLWTIAAGEQSCSSTRTTNLGLGIQSLKAPSPLSRALPPPRGFRRRSCEGRRRRRRMMRRMVMMMGRWGQIVGASGSTSSCPFLPVMGPTRARSRRRCSLTSASSSPAMLPSRWCFTGACSERRSGIGGMPRLGGGPRSPDSARMLGAGLGKRRLKPPVAVLLPGRRCR
mmetsp:Transcript_36356/g.102439  ORF Transcript_36356/g.102439 Transcript_36356/m.102439 type:complete len:216 (-) Transcript_36356:3230-3877(-)